MKQSCTPIPERSDITPAVFENEILPTSEPVVIRGLVAEWPLVRAAKRSPNDAASYLQGFDRGYGFSTAIAPPSAKGRFFYNEDFSGLNFKFGKSPLRESLEYLLDAESHGDPASLAVQSVPTRGALPGFMDENQNPLLSPEIEARIWIGNRVTIAAHYDPSENIACVGVGRRRFTLFPPEQVSNLYVGPEELTPAGAAISLVDFDNPDLEAFPRFPDAMAAAMTAELEPGDAIYIPYLWWHQVRSLDAFNILINYWWTPPSNAHGMPRDVLMHALLTLQSLPPAHRRAWKKMFDHYVFKENGEPAAHLPEERRGILGELDSEAQRQIRAALARKLSRL
ncbi:cupin-like domain-containing protein [Parvularcula sp. LCG005]|uniref:cupin-like domain-containing protein n=1 Tax=Parvularcula sp. LCG005 TaxID=3078805 RepID=UPI002943C8C0|nr:cupin-like domain-containing protein [Parvularcula sp. LCG005]WOI53450.1 cupin-like domain-containing protein [Parvularcula sp. LCG005]